MSIKEAIAQELLDAVGDPAGLEAVLQRYARSKGPLYLALAEATTQLERRLDLVVADHRAALDQREELQQEIATLEGRREDLEVQTTAQAEEMRRVRTELTEMHAPLEAARVLAAQGFGEAELRRLQELLGAIAAREGVGPEDSVIAFFQAVERYEEMVSFDLETTRAEARARTAEAKAERAVAEASLRETRAKARRASITATERLLAQGVKEADVLQWEQILVRAGTSPAQLTRALRQHGNLAKVIQAQRTVRDELRKETTKLTSQRTALQEQRDSLAAAIGAVGEQASQQVAALGGQATQLLQRLTQRGFAMGLVQGQVQELEPFLPLARAFRDNDRRYYQAASSNLILTLLAGCQAWAAAQGQGLRAQAPDAVRQRLIYAYRYTVSLADLLSWAIQAMLSAAPEPGQSARR